MLIKWDEKLSVSVQEMDNHHQQLVALINDLHEAMKTGKGKEIIVPTIKKLADYTNFHFSAEEKYMEKYNYPGLGDQKVQHRKFLEKLESFQKDIDSNKLMISMEVMNFLKDWLVNHINVTDKKYGSFFNEKGLK